MIRFRPRSMLTLVATGYLLVAMPLMISIPVAYRSVGELTRQSQRLVADTASLVDLGASLGDQISALDRAARQYAILQDPEGLMVVENRIDTVETTLDALGLFPDAIPMTPLLTIRNTIRSLPQRLVGGMPAAKPALADLGNLDLHRREVIREINTYVDQEVRAVNEQADRARRQLALPTVALIPASIALAIIFTYLTVRPIRQFSLAIRRMGRGRLDQPVEVEGPVELVELGHQLDWMRQQLLAMEQEKDRFLQHMSHELKTPLASFVEGLSLLREGVTGEPTQQQREVLDILSVSADQLKRLIENLLKFHAWADATQTPEMEPIRLRALIDKVLMGHRLSARASQLKVLNETRDITIVGHIDSLQLAISNLVSNAIKYSPEAGEVVVRGDENEDAWWLSVEDSGPGVAVAERESIFQPFVQGSGSGRGPLAGSGIGLAVVATCMRRHGGIVHVDSSPNGGALFTLQAPKTL